IATVSAAAAAFGAVVAAGQSAVEAVRGHYQQKIATQKAEDDLKLNRERGEQDLRINELKSKQDLELAQVQSDSTLSEAYLKIIFGKDTKENDQFMIVKALSSLDKHPLHAWAKSYQEQREKLIADSDVLNRRLREVLASNKPQAEKDVEETRVRMDLKVASYQNAMSSGDLAGSQKIAEDILLLARKLALQEGERGKLQV